MHSIALGIDISKVKFDCTLLLEEKGHHKVFSNDLPGLEELFSWLATKTTQPIHACMEATGRYWELVAKELVGAGFLVSVVNPARVKGFSQSELKRIKTDKVDSGLIARFCRALKPEPWIQQTDDEREIQELRRYLDSLGEMIVQQGNRLSSGIVSTDVGDCLEEHLQYLHDQSKLVQKKIDQRIQNCPDLNAQKELITSIIGVGAITADVFIAEIGSISRFPSAGHLASFVGMTPKERLSGSSVRGKARLSKIGNARLRKALYFPAISAIKHNPVISKFYLRLRAAGKPPMVALCAAMRKLLCLIYEVLKSKTLFRIPGTSASFLPGN
jgi:transposase